MIRLYEIPSEWASIADRIDAAGGELTPEIEADMVALLGATKDKIQSAALAMRNYRIQADASRDMAARVKMEVERIMAQADAFDRIADSIGRAMLPALEVTGKVQTPAGTVHTRTTPHYEFALKPDYQFYDLSSELWRQRDPELNKTELKRLAQIDKLPEAILVYKDETTTVCLTAPRTKKNLENPETSKPQIQGENNAANQESCA
jgi:hypothetical protein